LGWRPGFPSIFEGLIEIMDTMVWFVIILQNKIKQAIWLSHTFVTF
jgi:hypothetical protein